jgi:four helix bundle protein
LPIADCRIQKARIMTKLDLQRRTKQFALRVLKLVDSLPNRRSGWIIGDQLGRCATSVGANYRAACKSRSRAEFISKIGVVEEEADESAFWLEMILGSAMLASEEVGPLLREANELVAIMGASRITAAARRSGARPPIGNRQSAIGNS